MICLTAVLTLCRTLLFLNLSGLICRNRQKNINFANDNEDAVSCGSVKQRQREEMTMPCRIYTKGEVLPSRQVSYTDIPRASPPATTASLSTALQAGHNMFLFFNDNWDNRNNGVNRRQRENVTRWHLFHYTRCIGRLSCCNERVNDIWQHIFWAI